MDFDAQWCFSLFYSVECSLFGAEVNIYNWETTAFPPQFLHPFFDSAQCSILFPVLLVQFRWRINISFDCHLQKPVWFIELQYSFLSYSVKKFYVESHEEWKSCSPAFSIGFFHEFQQFTWNLVILVFVAYYSWYFMSYYEEKRLCDIKLIWRCLTRNRENVNHYIIWLSDDNRWMIERLEDIGNNDTSRSYEKMNTSARKWTYVTRIVN